MTDTTSILYLDHDENRRDARLKVLVDAGYRIVEARTEKEVLLMGPSLQPDLIVVAGATPHLAARIRQVFLHGSTSECPPVITMGTQDGNVGGPPIPDDPADNRLVEPVSTARFLAAVRASLRLAHLEKDNRRLIEQLTQAEQRFVDIAQAAGCGLWEWDIPTGRLEWNGMHEQLAGMRPSGFSAKIEAFLDVLHPEDRERVWRELGEAMARRNPRFCAAYRFVRADGSVRWMQGTGRFFYNAQGVAVRMTGVVQDISERKQAEEALRDSGRQQRILLNAVKDCAIFMLDPQGRISSWNDGAQRMFGYKASDVMGHDHGLLYPGDSDVDRPAQALRLASECGRYEQREWRTRKNGSRVLANVTITALRDEDDHDGGFAVVSKDMTEAKEAESRLAFYRTIIEASTDAVAIIDRHARYVEQNEAHRLLLGYTDDELLGRLPTLHVDGATYERVMSNLTATGRFEGEIVSTRKDGRRLDIEMKVFPVKDDAGGAHYFVGIKRDVTARKQADRALRESEERFHTLADNISQFAWMADSTGSIFWYNRRWFDYTGTTLEQMKGWGWTAVHHPDHIERVVSRIQHAWDKGEPWEDTFPLRSADGTYRWFLSRAVPIRDAEGRILRWFGTNTDVTDLRDAEDALRQREKQLRIVTDSVPSLISYVDREERYRFVNAGYEHMFGLSRQQIVGRSARELLGDTYANVVAYVRRALSGEPVLFEDDLVYAGVSHTVQVFYTPDVGPDGTVAGFYVLVTDISERKRQENELRRWKDELGCGTHAGARGFPAASTSPRVAVEPDRAT